MCSLKIIIAFCIALAASSTAELDTTPQTFSNDTQPLFRIVPPERGMLTIFYDNPPTPCSVLMYAHEEGDNFTVSIESTETEVATFPGEVKISPCQIKSEWNVSTNTDSAVKYVDASESREFCYNLTFRGNAVFLGYSNVKFFVRYSNNNADVGYNEIYSHEVYAGEVLLRTIRRPTIIQVIFDYAVRVLVTFAVFAMGNSLDIPTIKHHLRRPKAPVIALLSQFTIMPLVSYGIIRVMGLTGGKALGFFALGCSPGGGGSNMFAKLFNGDMSLSVTLTTLSTVMSLGMLPFWIYTLGRTIPADAGVAAVQIPFVNIAQSLAFIIIPLGLGALVSYKLPRVSRVIKKCLKVIFLLVLLFFFTFGLYANRYMFQAWDGPTLLVACLLPYSGYLLGGLLAWAFRFDWTLIKTIALEIGMQNTSVAILIVKTMSQQPDSDLALILPAMSGMATGWPLLVMLPVYLIRQKILNNRKAKLEAVEGTDESSKLGGDENDSQAITDSSEASEDRKSERTSNGDVEMKLINDSEKL